MHSKPLVFRLGCMYRFEACNAVCSGPPGLARSRSMAKAMLKACTRAKNATESTLDSEH